MNGAYYNEFDAEKAAWLRELIAQGHIAPGEVDERSIKEIQADDLRPYTQCHFFAGIGVWSYALRQAGWSDDRAVWTGSCPCQGFSIAGKRLGFGDPRHLWPDWFKLIAECRPSTIFGEQSASKDALSWLDLVQSNLENTGYACGATDICAAGFGAPHIRQRLYFVANTTSGGGLNGRGIIERCNSKPDRREAIERGECGQQVKECGSISGPVNGFWGPAEWIYCRDNKYRAVEPGTFPLAHGATQRVGRLRGYGDAIVAEVAKEFIEAYRKAVE